jgi:succinoglycan biosynthesis protein ExoM
VDDNPDGAARPVIDEFAEAFELGIHYRQSGKGNISIARNLALETAAPLAEWVLMTDDDCEPPRGWVAAHLNAQRQSGCDATAGAMVLRVPPEAPPWLTDQPFALDYELRSEHLQRLPAAGTSNVMMRSAWLLQHPAIRFREDLGRTGGEDWVFFRSASKAGLVLRFVDDADTSGIESADRLTWRYVLENRLWMGNIEFFINSMVEDTPRNALVALGWRRLGQSVLETIRRSDQFRYRVSVLARCVGYLLAVAGIRLNHH